MARPIKNTVDYFPQWRPKRLTSFLFVFGDERLKYKTIRSSSSSFTQRKDVRDFIFKRDNYQCVLCGSKENLQLDHIHSIYQVANNLYPIELLNTEENLRTLCKKCNAGKTP